MRAAFLGLLLLAACAAAPPAPRLYLLEAPQSASTAQGSGAEAVGVREISLPLYARRLQIAAEDGAGAVSASEDHLWAEEPARAATRLVARRLAMLRGGPVYADPWPQGAAPAIILSLEADRLLGSFGGEARLEGQMSLSCAAARDRIETRPFAVRAGAAGADHAALVNAYGAALAALAGDAAAALETFGPCPR